MFFPLFTLPPHPHLCQRIHLRQWHENKTGKYAWRLCHNIRRYGTKCNGCNQGISPSELVRKSRDNKVFHLNCLTCFLCRRELSTGDQLYIVDDNKFMCKEDYLLHKHGQHSSLSGECLNATRFYCLFRILFHFLCLVCVYVCNCCWDHRPFQ